MSAVVMIGVSCKLRLLLIFPIQPVWDASPQLLHPKQIRLTECARSHCARVFGQRIVSGLKGVVLGLRAGI